MRKFLFIILCGLWTCFASEKALPVFPALPVVNSWSGREQVLDFDAKIEWHLESEFGRLLAQSSGGGRVVLNLPPLTACENAILVVDGRKTAVVHIYPAKILDGIVANLGDNREKLEKLGATQSQIGDAVWFVSQKDTTLRRIGLLSYAARIVVFTDHRDFPITIGPEWSDFSFGLARDSHKNTGAGSSGMSLVLDKRERIIDHGNGPIAWFKARHVVGDSLLLLPPEFDFDNIDDMVFLKKELEKWEK